MIYPLSDWAPELTSDQIARIEARMLEMRNEVGRFDPCADELASETRRILARDIAV